MRVTNKGVFAEYGDKEFVLLSIFDNKEYRIFHSADSISEMIKDLQKMLEKAKGNIKKWEGK